MHDANNIDTPLCNALRNVGSSERKRGRKEEREREREKVLGVGGRGGKIAEVYEES